MINLMGEDCIYGKMEKGMKENGRKGSFMEKGLRLYLMEQFLMEIGLKEDQMDLECANTPMGQSIQEPGRMDSLMARELRYYLMGLSIRGIGLMGKPMD